MKKTAPPNEAITPAEYRAFQDAYDFFNAQLFAGSLPDVLDDVAAPRRRPEATFRRSVSPAAVEQTDGARTGDEPGQLSPGAATRKYYRPSRMKWRMSGSRPTARRRAAAIMTGEWAAKMKEIGLQPSTTGEPGGKETGQSVTHYIIPGGEYAPRPTRSSPRPAFSFTGNPDPGR